MKAATMGDGFSDHLPQPRITVGVKEKPTQFLVDTGAQHSVFQANGTVCKKRSPRSPWHQNVFMDYLKNSGPRDGMGSPFI